MKSHRSSRAHSNTRAENIDFLNMPGWRSIPPVHNTGSGYLVEAEVDSDPPPCKNCETTMYRFKRNGTRPRTFQHVPYMHRPVTVSIRLQFFLCNAPGCNKASQQTLPGVDENHKITRPLREYILSAMSKHGAKDLERETGVSERVIREIYNEHISAAHTKGPRLAPRWLGIDDLYLGDNTYCVLTDIQNRVIYDLLPSDDGEELRKYLTRMPGQDLVQVVTMDMSNTFRAAARKALPYATIVADRFHVVRLANKSLDAVRKRLQKKLDVEARKQLKREAHVFRYADNHLTNSHKKIRDYWFQKVPEMETAYRVKERFRRIWAAGDPEEALRQSERWSEKLPPELFEEFRHIVTQIDRWGEEIFNFCRPDLVTYDEELEVFRGATNGYAEAANGLIRKIWEKGNGYSFKVLRAKALEQPKLPGPGFITGLRRSTKKTILSTPSRMRRRP